jgi:hypothetical protein
MKEEPVKKSWTEGMNGETPPRHLIQSHLQQQNQERLQEMAAEGVREVQVICATNHECPACAELDGETFAIDDAPTLPPARCSCMPHCTCILTAIAGL